MWTVLSERDVALVRWGGAAISLFCLGVREAGIR